MGDLKATPGPWATHPVQRWVSPEADMEMPICALRWATYGEMVEPDEVRANAALIAAAPELYEAAEIALSLIEGGRIYEQQCCNGRECGCHGSTYADEAEHYLRAALSKARGEPPQSIREGVDRD